MTLLKILFFKSSVNSKSLSRRQVLMLSLPPLNSTRQKSLTYFLKIDFLLNFSTSYEFFRQNILGNKCAVLLYQIHFDDLCRKHQICGFTVIIGPKNCSGNLPRNVQLQSRGTFPSIELEICPFCSVITVQLRQNFKAW